MLLLLPGMVMVVVVRRMVNPGSRVWEAILVHSQLRVDPMSARVRVAVATNTTPIGSWMLIGTGPVQGCREERGVLFRKRPGSTEPNGGRHLARMVLLPIRCNSAFRRDYIELS